MESEDEEVIFENSVLHQALVDIGVTDLTTEPRLQVEDNDENGPHAYSETNSLTNKTESKRPASLHSSFIARIFYSQKALDEVHHYHRYHILKWLLSSHILSEDDQLFLQSYVDEEPPTRGLVKCLSVYTVHFICLLVASLVLVNFMCPVDVLSSWVMLLIDRMPQMFSGLSLYSSAISAILLNLTWILCVAGPLLALKRRVCQKILSQMKKQNKHIQDMVTEAVELLRLEKKCLRLVKESELVARGFTLASQHHVASRGGQGHMTSSSSHLCPGLRQVMFSENILVMQEIKKWVVKMLRSIPMICADSDFNTLQDLKMNESSSNPAENTQSGAIGAGSTGQDLQDHGTETSADAKKELAACHTYAVISPSELSRSVELLSVYLSGFVRRLALCFYTQNLRDKTINPFVATRECTEMSRMAIKRARTLLKQSYMFYRAFHQSDGNGAPKKVQGSRHMGQSQIYNLYVCVNSLDLHLQSLLHITRGLTMALEDRVDREQCELAGMDSTELKPVSEDDRELWEGVLKKIKSSLESCRACYEESLKHLHQRIEKDTPTKSIVKDVSTDMSQPKQTKVTWIPAEDPVIVDQVFEAISDAVEEEDFPESRPRHKAEDKVKHQEEKEAIKRFRQELQTVVGHRAVFQKAREERALARARGETHQDEESDLELSSACAPGADSEILTQNAEASLDFSTEEVKPTEAVLAKKLQSGVMYPTQATLGPGITCHKQSAELKPDFFSSVQTKEEKQRGTHYEVGKVSQSAVPFRDTSSWEQPNQMVGEDSSCSFPVTNNLITASPDRGETLFVQVHDTNPAIQSEITTKDSQTLENIPDICSDFESACLKHLTAGVGDVHDGDKANTENRKINQEVILLDNSEPHNKSCTRYKQSADSRDSVSDTDLVTLNRKEGSEGNIIDSATFKDSNCESVLFQYATNESSNLCEPLPSCHGAEQGLFMSSNPNTSSETSVSISHENMITKTGNEIRNEVLRQKDVNLKKSHDGSLPTLPSSSFTKSIAILAASQARVFTSSHLQEEQFGDESSDSDIDISQSVD